MYRLLFISFSISFFLIFSGCKTTNDSTNRNVNSNNFIISVYDSGIDNPDNDRRCYYIVYIDKIEAGRTTTGLESQNKTFETVLTTNRHLVKIEKWVLNEEQGRYLKVNNIDQPKPDYVYINILKARSVTVQVKSSKTGIASYSLITE